MFDAKSLIEMMMKGAAPAAQGQAGGQAGGLGGLGDILGKLAQGQGGGRGSPAAAGGGGLEDILRNLTQGGQGGGAGGAGGLGDLLRNMIPGAGQAAAPRAAPETPAAGAGSGGLGEILGQLQKQLGGQGGHGGLMDVLGQVLGQATSGVKEGAQRIDNATGVGKQARDAIGQATGKSPEELLEQLKELIRNNQTAAAAGAGGLGAVVLGTRAGRSLAGSAAKLGALVLIGGLAYKAYENYSNGKPLLTGSNFTPSAAPAGTGFEPQAVTQESAALYIRAMIAAAAADGRIDATEQQKIIGGLKQAGMDAEAEEFIANELNNPASVDDLAGAVSSAEEAVQLYTAARIAIDVDTDQEHAFLAELASKLQLEPQLVQHIDAAANSAGS